MNFGAFILFCELIWYIFLIIISKIFLGFSLWNRAGLPCSLVWKHPSQMANKSSRESAFHFFSLFFSSFKPTIPQKSSSSCSMAIYIFFCFNRETIITWEQGLEILVSMCPSQLFRKTTDGLKALQEEWCPSRATAKLRTILVWDKSMAVRHYMHNIFVISKNF